ACWFRSSRLPRLGPRISCRVICDTELQLPSSLNFKGLTRSIQIPPTHSKRKANAAWLTNDEAILSTSIGELLLAIIYDGRD
ncbi:hypothetical protein HAX54_009826, partial [Datura stramonium]|nr:hypothetical protein [Datura stramonium]